MNSYTKNIILVYLNMKYYPIPDREERWFAVELRNIIRSSRGKQTRVPTPAGPGPGPRPAGSPVAGREADHPRLSLQQSPGPTGLDLGVAAGQGLARRRKTILIPRALLRAVGLKRGS